MNDITLHGISKRFGDRIVLENFSAVFPAGETSVLMGVSGGGKTTLLRLILGLETLDGGEISGVPAKCAAVFQEDRLCPQLTALGNVLLAAGRRKEREARDLLGRLGLAESINTPAADLSGGMRRRTALARALCADWDLLVLDEPFKGLDEATRRTAIETVREQTEGRTVLLVTHDPTEAKAFGDNIIRVPQGT
jgi:NitT/TauT family transport system ATP-binding protein